MIRRGDCLACAKLSQCRETDLEKVLRGFTCPLFEEASEPVYQARWDAMQQYGERAAVRAMLPLHSTEEEGEEVDA
jgi:hypothetical protein